MYIFKESNNHSLKHKSKGMMCSFQSSLFKITISDVSNLTNTIIVYNSRLTNQSIDQPVEIGKQALIKIAATSIVTDDHWFHTVIATVGLQQNIVYL